MKISDYFGIITIELNSSYMVEVYIWPLNKNRTLIKHHPYKYSLDKQAVRFDLY